MTTRVMLIGLLLSACGESEALPYESDAGPLTFEIGEPGFVPWVDDGEAELTWGPQGGVMVRPVLRLPIGEWPATGEYAITLVHSPDPAHPTQYGVDPSTRDTHFSSSCTPRPGEVPRCFSLTPIDGFLEIGPLYNQLAMRGIDDTYTQLDVTVEGPGGRRATQQLTLHLIEPIAVPEARCDQFAVEAETSSCSYRAFPGRAEVTQLTHAWEGGEWRRQISYQFRLDDYPDAIECERRLEMETGRERTHVFEVPCDAIAIGQEIAATRLVGSGDCPDVDRIDPSVCQ